MKTDKILKMLLTTALMAFLGVMHADAAKVRQQVCGRIHLKSGKVIEVADSNRIGTPAKKHSRLVIIENAFTKAAKDGDTFEGAEVDSVNIWQRTRTDRVRTLVYEPDYGWCWKLEGAGGVTLCVFSGDGYFLAGNGGMSVRGKSIYLVKKDGKIYEFDKGDKMADDAFRRQIAAFVADDQVLSRMILESRLTRIKTLRMLGSYVPQ